jgi:hypothetical protein
MSVLKDSGRTLVGVSTTRPPPPAAAALAAAGGAPSEVSMASATWSAVGPGTAGAGGPVRVYSKGCKEGDGFR